MQLHVGDLLFVYDIQENIRTKIVEFNHFNNYEFNGLKKTYSSSRNHSLLIHFSTDDQFVDDGFSAIIHYIPSNIACGYFLDSTELMLNQEIDCTNWIITAPSPSIISIKFQYFEVTYILNSYKYIYYIKGVLNTKHA